MAKTDIESGSSHDVVIIGYGPVGRLLALKLGLRGHRVLVVEKQRATYFLPRAVHIDDEASRILQSVGAGPDEMPEAIGPYNDFYEWRNADRETILRLDWRGRGPSGWNVSNFFNQPLVERVLDARVQGLDTVRVAYGVRATGMFERNDDVEVQLQDASGEPVTVYGKYVIGSDGANSMVRELIGGTTTDLGYFHDWLVVDLVMKNERIVFDPPAWQLCDPLRPTTLVPGGPGRRRFEFMRLPEESRETLAEDATTWRLLEPWGIGPEDATIERNTLYTFQAKWADDWRRGRVLIAGDAAHLMPPFAGQGMCSGLRDAANLEWKLDLVLRNLAPDSLLESYASERKEHVRHFIEASMALGEVICITDSDRASERDFQMRADFLAGLEQEARPLPRLGDGFFEGGPAGGHLSIQAVVESPTGVGLFDDVTGGGGVLIVRRAELASGLSAPQMLILADCGIRVIALGHAPADGVVVDLEGALVRWLDGYDASAALVRPDFYIYGTASTTEEVTALVHRFTALTSKEIVG